MAGIIASGSLPLARADSAMQALTQMRAPAAAIVILTALAGCAQVRPYVPPSEGHIMQAPKPVVEAVIPPPARVSSFVPPPRPTLKPQTYSVVVNEVPVKELLNALARDTRQNIDIHPTISGLVSLNAIDETLPALLERISKQVDIRYRTEGNTIIVSPDQPYIKTYVVNYVNIQRNTSSVTGASGQIGTGVGGGGGGGASGGSGGGGGSSGSSGNTSSTTVTTTSSSDFWRLLETAVRAILNSALQQSLSADAKQQRLQTIRQEQELRVKQLEATVRGQAGQPPTANSQPVTSPSANLLADDVIVNALAGTVTINGTEKQHQLVQDYLSKVERGAQRQVLIEATIVEVVLSNAYQGGVDFNRLSQSGGVAFQSALAGSLLGPVGTLAGPLFALTFNQNNQRQGDISATVRLLEQFGRTRVLSSPKLMALNNQTALLKVVTNLVYFEITTQPAVVTTGVISQPQVNASARTVSEGVVMSVTPQINDDGRVTLTVRPTITDRIGDATDPTPGLPVANLVPIMRVREMESVLQVANAQTVILGGLMQDRTRFDRNQIPIAGDIPIAGEAFRFRNELASKTELIIFLRPTVIENPSLESDELKFFQRYLPQVGGSAADRGPGAP